MRPTALALTVAPSLLAACVSAPERGAGAPADPLAAAAVAEVSEARLRADLAKLVSFGTRHTRSETDSDVRGIGAARRWLHARLQRVSDGCDGRLVVTSQRHVIGVGRRMPEETELVNVVAEIRGSEPGRVVILSGHYDSRNSRDEDVTGDAPGANDDGSGTVAVLEAARAVCAALGGCVPRATIRFACVAGEEQGLYGSRAMARADRDAGLDVVAMITNDIVGGREGGNGLPNRGHVRLFSEGVPSGDGAPSVVGSDNDAPSRQLGRRVAAIAADAVPGLAVQLVFRQDRFLRGGDHKAYNELGYPAVRLTETHEHFDRQHQDVRVEGGRAYGDTLEHVDFAHLADVTRLDAAAVLTLALAPPAPTGVAMDAAELSHDTRLRWDDPGDPSVAGYRVRMRATDAPDWQAALDVGRVFAHTLQGASKDHVLFAVEAYDRDGRTSVMVYPEPRSASSEVKDER